ncbi:SGNH/GDSL hydrolase family protein [uncultured Clostridium sp.]|uniref:SGNH/GDSL hydrolase family protein n=1 Tax=uncultured Clostridium sp. TaxID=59620 RepID=UPI00260B88E4|nr:SGNH/GDSL hydrolase family protein [uncultured Clostridium sp.]
MRSIFVIGDSVSIHYGTYLKELSKGKFKYDRKKGDEALIDLDKPLGANAGDSTMVLEYLKSEKENGTRHDILLINCGLHDIRRDRMSQKIQTDIDDYEENLRQIIDIAKVIGNEVIWVMSTPVVDEIHNKRIDGFLRYNLDLEEYNTVAKKVMEEKNIKIIDLNRYTKALGTEIYCDHVHFKSEIRMLQANFIINSLN